MPTPITVLLAAFATAVTLPSYGSSPETPNVPAAVQVPAGHSAFLRTTGIGLITYECRAKAGSTVDHEWTFIVPEARLLDGSKREVGRYYGGPTWEAGDGSKVTGKQVAIAPAGAGNIPLQLVKAEPVPGRGAMSAVTYVQRLDTVGGVAPAEPCTTATAGSRRQVNYQADYVFYRL